MLVATVHAASTSSGAASARMHRNPDQRHGEVRRELVEVGVRVDLAGTLCVGESVAECPCESLEVGGDVAPAPGVERGPLDCGVAHEGTRVLETTPRWRRRSR